MRPPSPLDRDLTTHTLSCLVQSFPLTRPLLFLLIPTLIPLLRTPAPPHRLCVAPLSLHPTPLSPPPQQVSPLPYLLFFARRVGAREGWSAWCVPTGSGKARHGETAHTAAAVALQPAAEQQRVSLSRALSAASAARPPHLASPFLPSRVSIGAPLLFPASPLAPPAARCGLILNPG